MYIRQVVKARQTLTRPDGDITGKSKVKSRIVKGKIVYITKFGLVGLDLGRYKESFRVNEIMEV